MRRVAIVFSLLALIFWIGGRAEATSAPDRYTVGTACDDAWQEGVYPAFPTSGINPSKDYKWPDSPVGWDGQGHIFNPGFRFENVQVAPGEMVSSARLTLGFYNDFPSVSLLDVPVQVELGNARDICWSNDIIHRTFTDPVDWSTSLNPNGDTATVDITAMVQQAVNAPGWVKGGSILVRLVGEDGRAEYPYSYGWNVINWDCHCGSLPTLEIG